MRNEYHCGGAELLAKQNRARLTFPRPGSQWGEKNFSAPDQLLQL